MCYCYGLSVSRETMYFESHAPSYIFARGSADDPKPRGNISALRFLVFFEFQAHGQFKNAARETSFH